MPKNERNYAAQPVADALGLRAVIDGLAHDLQQMRDRQISPAEGMARAAVAKQLCNAARLYLQAVTIAERHQNRPGQVQLPSADTPPPARK